MREFQWYVDLGTAAVLWQEQGDEWLHRFGGCLSEKTALQTIGHKFDDTTRPFIAVRLGRDGQELPWVLLLGASMDEVRVLMAGDGDVDDATIEMLREAARCASDRLGEQGDAFEWSAVIGYDRERIGGGEKRLSEEVDVGGLALASSHQLFTEADSSQQASLSAWSIHRSVPILVRGTSRGYSWEAAAVRAGAALHRLCGLMSVAWDGPIVVREAAAPISWGLRYVPERSPWEQWDFPDESEPVDESHIAAADLPAWMDAAWSLLEEMSGVKNAVAAFHEGVRMANTHPSLSLVSFIASVEAIGTLLFKPARCSECGSHRDVAKRFRATLGRVVDAEEAALLGSAYGPRSRTVHAGHLHGGEERPGVFSTGIWASDPARDFRWNMLHRMQRASRLLLEDAFRNGLPPKENFSPED